MSKIWDCFSFLCEKELLQLRLEHLYNHVDYFVITEADMTHQGDKKNFLLPELLQDELSWAKSKIIPVYLNIEKDNLPRTNYPIIGEPKLGQVHDGLSWRIENFQRNACLNVLEQADIEDIILIGDVDEIPSRLALDNIRLIANAREIFTIGMINCPYYLDVVLEVDGNKSDWAGTVLGKKKHLIQPQKWRDIRELVHWEPKLGYHFSWIVHYMEQKAVSTAHHEISKYCELASMKSIATELKDFYQRENHVYRVRDVSLDPLYPKAFLNAREKFSFLFHG